MMKIDWLKISSVSIAALTLTSCAYSPGYSQFELTTPHNKQCLYLNFPYIDVRGIINTQYVYPAGNYRPLYEDANGTYYVAPTPILLKTFIKENLEGGVYIKNSNEVYGWSYPKLGTYGDIKVNGVSRNELPPTILYKLPESFIARIKHKAC